MGDEPTPKYYVCFVIGGFKFGSAAVHREIETWDDVVAIRRILAKNAHIESIEEVQIINWKRID